jgi:hypothetical protein
MSGGARDAAAAVAVANDAAPAKKKVKKNGRQSCKKNATIRVTVGLGLIASWTVSVMAVFSLGCILRIVVLSKTGFLPSDRHGGIAAPIYPARPPLELADIIRKMHARLQYVNTIPVFFRKIIISRYFTEKNQNKSIKN